MQRRRWLSALAVAGVVSAMLAPTAVAAPTDQRGHGRGHDNGGQGRGHNDAPVIVVPAAPAQNPIVVPAVPGRAVIPAPATQPFTGGQPFTGVQTLPGFQ